MRDGVRRGVSSAIVDASALLAILNQEPGTEPWAEEIARASISAVNLSEVVAKLADLGMSESEVRGILDPLGLDVVAFDAPQAYLAGLLRPATRELGLSLGDRACLALGGSLKIPVLTADRSWRKLRVGLEIRVIR